MLLASKYRTEPIACYVTNLFVYVDAHHIQVSPHTEESSEGEACHDASLCA